MMKRRGLKCLIVVMGLGGPHAAPAQSNAPGTTETVKQLRSVNDNVKRLFEKGSELSQGRGVDMGLKDMVRAGGQGAERIYDFVRERVTDAGETPKMTIVDTVMMDGYAASVENADLAAAGGNDGLSRAADHAKAMQCQFYPDSCKNSPASDGEPTPQTLPDFKGTRFTCNTVGLSPDTVAANGNLRFTSECSISGMPIGPKLNQSNGYLVAECRGWNSFVITFAQNRFPDVTYFPTVRTQLSATEENVQYSGKIFTTPCRPAWGAAANAGTAPRDKAQKDPIGHALFCALNRAAAICR